MTSGVLSGLQFQSEDHQHGYVTTIHAMADGKALGHIDIEHDSPSPTPRGKPSEFIQSLYVHPEDNGRRQGVGHALMREAVSRYGHKPMSLEPSAYGTIPGPGNDRLREFYAGHGFRDAKNGDMVRPKNA
jgi:ribosomal protein S18 acetylase RimI-like enzyme